jgi:2-oxoglutarate ferredoxin oxidoreductase subunit delta
MLEPEVIIDENTCMGCGYCVKFCPHGCIEISKDKFGPVGYPLAVVVHQERCTTCGTCAFMCPQYAIKVCLTEAEAV